jgi:hypothetical protein
MVLAREIAGAGEEPAAARHLARGEAPLGA